MPRKITKILVANRGEIALRIMRSAKEAGIKTVAVFSEADRRSPHVKYADQAVCLGAAPAYQSYLRGKKIIETAQALGVDAIHPGYGFLSENAEFARQVTDAGIIFIGPSPEAIQLMGDKLEAKAAVRKYNIPMVPGTDEAISDVEEAKITAQKVGFPILIKAAAGGGGKGMRIVNSPEEFDEQLKLAVSEATAAFGNGAVFIERYVSSPRHIEIQIMADSHRNICYLFERECSVQRRHQKVIEEAPSALLTPELRAEMGKCAVDVARACDYKGAGTVEFLMDEENNFYFLEMNTRLQVEHPVTEMITGIDLVREQIRVAQGEKLSFTQDELKINGHAIELRIYAEDPENNFMPDIGTLKIYRKPEGIGIRVDDGYIEGMTVPVYYDPMLAKLTVWGRNREAAIERMKRAIDEYTVNGIETTLSFGRFVMNHPAFIEGKYDTHFVERYFNTRNTDKSTDNNDIAAIAASIILHKESIIQNISTGCEIKKSNWKTMRM